MRRQSGNFNRKHSDNNSNNYRHNQNNRNHSNNNNNNSNANANGAGNRRPIGHNFTMYPAGYTSFQNNKPRTNRPTPDMDIVNIRPVFTSNYYANSAGPSYDISSNSGSSNFAFSAPGPSQQTINEMQYQRKSDRDVKVRLKELQHYVCPGCCQQYDYVCRNNRCTGRVPLVLSCQHTVCEDCLYKQPSNNGDSLKCPVCDQISKLNKQSANLQDTFPPNFYLLGLIFWSKLQSTRDPRSVILTMTPTETTLKNRRRADVTFKMDDDISKCGFVSCNKAAHVYCAACGTCFCNDCFGNIHKSVQALCNHKPTPINDISVSSDLMLDRCKKEKHLNMAIEYHCDDCDDFGCCHCFIHEHGGHQAVRLSYLDDAEMAEMETLREQSEEKLKRLLLAHKKFKELSASSTSSKIDKDIASFFLSFHAKLHDIQKHLHDQLANSSKNSPSGLGQIGVSINTSINTIKQLLCIENSTAQPINQRLLLEKMRNAVQVPCYLVGSTDGETVKDAGFSCDIDLKGLEDFFKLTPADNLKYRLVSADDLPEGHEVEDVQTEQLESAVCSLLNKKKISSSTSEDSIGSCFPATSNRLKKDHLSDNNFDKEQIYITYINSLDCFYIQLKRKKPLFNKLCKDIDAYAKKHLNDHPTEAAVNDLVLADNNVSGKQSEWCRARIINKYEGENEDKFEVFFIDYGYTKILPLTSLLKISPNLKLAKPFALQCQLYHPNSSIVWTKNAQVYMGKFIDKKEVLVCVRSQNNNIYVVDLYVTTSDGSCLGILDVLTHTCPNVVVMSEGEEGNNASAISKINRKAPLNTLNSKSLRIYPNSKRFKAGQKYRVFLASISSPDDLYVHLVDYKEAVDDLKVALEKAYKRSDDSGCFALEDTYAIVECEDKIRGNYHRAYIESVDWEKEINPIKAKLVDWGLSVSVDWDKVRLLNEFLAKKEALAIKIELADMAPKLGKSWDMDAKHLLVKHLLQPTELKMLVKDVEPLRVALFDPKSMADLCINAQIVAQGYATSTGPLSEIIEWKNDEAQNEIPKLDEDDMVSNMFRKFEEDLDEINQSEFNSSGLQQQVEIVRVVDPSRIYIKFLCKYKDEQKLIDELQIHYHDPSVKKQFEEQIQEKRERKEGDLVVVMHKQLKVFCRAMIKEIQPDAKLVYLCDIGDDITVNDKDIFDIDPYFTTFPNVIYKCHLANIKPAANPTKWNQLSIEILDKVFTKYKSIFVTKVREWQPDETENVAKKSIPVYMWYQRRIDHPLQPPTFQHISINYLLIHCGLATKVPALNAPPAAIEAEKVNEKDDKKNQINISDVEDDMKFSFKNKFRPRKSALEMTTSTKWLDPLPIKETVFKAHFTYADCGYVCVRPAALESVYENLESSMKTHFMANPPTMCRTDWKPYDMCTILYDGLYYRGSVVNVSDDIATVIMIDFGSYHIVDVSTLFPLLMHTDIPTLVVKMKLHDVHTKCKLWSEEDNQVVLKLVPEYGEVRVVGEDEDGVQLIEIYDEEVSVNNAIIKASKNFIRLKTPPLDTSTETDLDESITTEDAVVVLQDEEVEPELKPNKFPLNQRIEVCVKQVLSHNELTIEVYIPLGDDQNKDAAPLPEISPTNDDIDELYNDIQNSADSLPELYKIQVGILCVCKREEEWHRARIIRTDSLACGTITVLFIDEGFVASVCCLTVKKMKPEWYEVPAKCPTVRINVKLAKKVSKNLIRDGLDSVMSNRFLFMEVLRMEDNKPVVNIWEKAVDGYLAYNPLITKNQLIVN